MPDMNEFDREVLREVFSNMYLHGRCVPFAIALHRRTGWPCIAVRKPDGRIVHAGVRDPELRAMDIRGHLTDAVFSRLFGGDVTETTSEELLSIDSQADEASITAAGRIADLLFPDLPGSCAVHDKLARFAVDLETLCRRSGVWIRPEGPHGIPAYDAYGDEGPFAVSFGPDGSARIQRTLAQSDDDVSFRKLIEETRAETKVMATAELARIEKVRDFPNNTCPSSRHAQMCAEALITEGRYGMIEDEPEHVGSSIATVIGALWTARSTLYELGYDWKIDADGNPLWVKTREPQDGSRS